jgi:hypothetical protein
MKFSFIFDATKELHAHERKSHQVKRNDIIAILEIDLAHIESENMHFCSETFRDSLQSDFFSFIFLTIHSIYSISHENDWSEKKKKSKSS